MKDKVIKEMKNVWVLYIYGLLLDKIVLVKGLEELKIESYSLYWRMMILEFYIECVFLLFDSDMV